MKGRGSRKSKAGTLRVLPVVTNHPATGPRVDLLVVEKPPTEEEKIREQRQLVDIQRGQRSEQLARHTRETAELIARHEQEERILAEHQQRDLAQLYRRHGRELSGFQLRALGEVEAWTGTK